MGHELINKAFLKTIVTGKQVRLGDGYYEELTVKLNKLIEDSINRTKENKRKTTYSKDL